MDARETSSFPLIGHDHGISLSSERQSPSITNAPHANINLTDFASGTDKASCIIFIGYVFLCLSAQKSNAVFLFPESKLRWRLLRYKHDNCHGCPHRPVMAVIS